MKRVLRLIVYGNAIAAFVAAVYFLVIPAGIVVHALRDPGLSAGEVPRVAFQWHRSLSDRYEPWARNRVASGRAAQLGTHHISGTEWPIFSSVFYLWTTEALQEAWEQNPSLAPLMPRQYAKGAIEAAAALVADPNHAAWVKEHWGDDYLHRENLFYRMLLISGLTSYQKLLGDDAYQSFLREQVATLAKEIDDSPFGLLDDYPGECYPVDVLPAIAAIRRADRVLGTDHSAFVSRALRAFEGPRLDPRTDLPAYVAISKIGQGQGSARGVGISFMLMWAPELWPETARQWYQRYEHHFWREGTLLVGVREFPAKHSLAEGWLVDVDAGPVLAGYGTAASAFGIGAARANGYFEHAYPLSAQALAVSWPLADGTLLWPRLLSDLSDAPYVGEAALLFSFTRRSTVNSTGADARLPLLVYLVIGVYVVLAIAVMGATIVQILRWERSLPRQCFMPPGWQLGLWVTLMVLGAITWVVSSGVIGALLWLMAQFLPRARLQITEADHGLK